MNGLTSCTGRQPTRQAQCRSPDRCVGADSFLTKDILTSPFPFSLIHWHTERYQIALQASKKYLRSVELFTDTKTSNLRIILESSISLLITHRGSTRFTRFKGNIHPYQHQSTHIVNFGGTAQSRRAYRGGAGSKSQEDLRITALTTRHMGHAGCSTIAIDHHYCLASFGP